MKRFLTVFVPVAVLAALAVAGYPQIKQKYFNSRYPTYAECAAKAKVACKFYFVGDFGQEWRPSAYKTEAECNAKEKIVGSVCVSPKGDFTDTRWISSVDLERAGSEAGAKKGTDRTPAAGAWGEAVKSQFIGLADWQEKNLSEWQLAGYEYDAQRREALKAYGTGQLSVLSKPFNENGCKSDCSAEKAAQDNLLANIKSALSQNGWNAVSWPAEPGFYQDYLYVKNGHPLVLQVGARDAVAGGMYISLEFLN